MVLKLVPDAPPPDRTEPEIIDAVNQAIRDARDMIIEAETSWRATEPLRIFSRKKFKTAELRIFARELRAHGQGLVKAADHLENSLPSAPH